jgi:hypothetical protein
LPRFRADDLRIGWIFLKFLPELTNKDANELGVRARLATPNLIDDLAMGDGPVWVFGQQRHKHVFPTGKPDFCFIQDDAAPVEINAKVAKVNHRLGRADIGAAGVCPNPRQKLTGGEGL